VGCMSATPLAAVRNLGTAYTAPPSSQRCCSSPVYSLWLHFLECFIQQTPLWVLALDCCGSCDAFMCINSQLLLHAGGSTAGGRLRSCWIHFGQALPEAVPQDRTEAMGHPFKCRWEQNQQSITSTLQKLEPRVTVSGAGGPASLRTLYHAFGPNVFLRLGAGLCHVNGMQVFAGQRFSLCLPPGAY
jgi:hypothetical protein